MPLTIKEEAITTNLNKTCTENGLGELRAYYYAVHQPPTGIMIFLGGLLQAFLIKPFYIGMTDSHLILQPLTSMSNPKGQPIVAEFNEVEYIGQKKVMLGMKTTFKLYGKKYGLRMNRKVVGWKNSGEQFDRTIKIMKGRLGEKEQDSAF